MARIHAWLLEQRLDSEHYNPLCKTKREALAIIARDPNESWTGLYKVSFEYRDAFDLVSHFTGPNGGRLSYAFDVVKRWEGEALEKLIAGTAR
jgi:hypothetical protein